MEAETEKPESTEVVAVVRGTGEVVDPARLPVPVERVGGMPLFRLEMAQQLRQRLDQYQADYLRDEHYVFYASWVHNNRRKRRGFDSDRAGAEQEARKHPGGRVEPIKKKIAYEILAMPLQINSEPLPQQEVIRGCYAHKGAHPVFREFWRVSTADGRYAIASGTMAGCEKLADDEETVLFGGRGEHDTPATAEARAYVRGMKQLLGFGEPAPYTPGQESPTGAATPTRPPAVQEHPEDIAAAWSRMAARAKELAFPDWAAVHAHFKVSPGKGELRQLANQRAYREGISLIEAIAVMTEELSALPEDEPPPPEPETEDLDLPPDDIP